MPPAVPRCIALALMVLLAAGLRLWDLPRRPMHADEANQAVKTGLLLDGEGYAFDPRDHHGPSLYYLTLPVAYLRGEHSLAALSETTVRLVPALAGTLAVVLLALIGGGGGRSCRRRHGSEAMVSARPPPGRAAANGPAAAPPSVGAHAPLFLLAAAFLAVSPPAVYYARDYIQETLLVTCTLLGVFAIAFRAQATTRSGQRLSALAAGVAAGLMLATKESAPLLFLAALGAAICARWFVPARGPRARPAAWGWCASDVLLALVAAVFIAALFYSSFFQHVAGVRDALLAPVYGLHRATGVTGHEKPWWYYLALLSFTRAGGLVWEQWLFIGLALIGAGAGLVRRDPWLVGAGVYAGLLLIALSAVPYKTPWNVLAVVPALCVLAAGGVLALARLPEGTLPAAAFAALALASLLTHSVHAAFRRAADARNPWAYVQSSPDVWKFRPLAEAALAAAPTQPVRVISPEYWPLPWYLRGLPRVGYWNQPPADCDGALVITSADLAATVRSRLHGPYRENFLGLRPGVVCVVFTAAQ